LILLSVVGAGAWVAYDVHVQRNPAEQSEPHPDKKTLVILGMHLVNLPLEKRRGRSDKTLILGTGWGSVSLLKKLDTENYNVIVVSPRNFFLFTPLLPSCTTGLIEHRSIMEPIRNILRHKKAKVKYYEAQATKIDYEKKVVYISDESEIRGDTSTTEVPFDLLVIGVGAENATFGRSKAISDALQIDGELKVSVFRYSRREGARLFPQGSRRRSEDPKADYGLC
jgi:NADH:ubiquinone reductase (non-electrogenic)